MGGAGGAGGSSPAPTYHLTFDGVDDQIAVPASASLNDLPLGNFTIDFSFEDAPGIHEGYFAKKGIDEGNMAVRRGWSFYRYKNAEGSYIYASAYCGEVSQFLYVDTLADILIPDGINHYEVVFDFVAKEARLYLNGVSIGVDDSNWTSAVYQTDASLPLSVANGLWGGVPYPALGDMHWFRISNVARHSANFTPPSLTIAPASDANTVLLLKLDEGSGTTANDSSANNNDGTITGATWVDDSATYHLYFDGIDDKILVPAATNINNLPLGDFTIDFSIELDGGDSRTDGYIVRKGNGLDHGWSIFPYRDTQSSGWWIYMEVYYSDGFSYVDLNEAMNLDGPIHIEYVYTASAGSMQLFVNGVKIDQYIYIDTIDGVYAEDSAFDLEVMSGMSFGQNYPVPGNVRWLRISNIARHTDDFIPPSLTVAPAKDANTLLLLALKENTGTIATDTSGHNSHGTIMGATWVQDTYHLTFDGVDDKITIPSSPSLTDLGSADFTIDMSVFLPDPAPGDASVEGYLYSKSGLGGSDAYKLYAYLYAMGYVEIPVPVVGEHGVAGLSATMSDYPSSGWHHIEIAWDSIERTVAVYVDGVALNIYQASMTNILPTDAFHNFVIASVDPALTTVTDFLPATYHWFRVSNTVRHADDFTPPSLTIAPANDANTLLLLTMNEGAGTTAYDSSGKGNDGVITGATWGLDKTDFHTAYIGAYDDIPNIAAAYGMRRLRSDYQGPLLRLRASYDNHERDIFYLANGNIDEHFVSLVLNGSAGYVVTWYDQSGNGNHATRPFTAAQEPLYVANGKNGKPMLRGDAIDDSFNTPLILGNPYSFVGCYGLVDLTGPVNRIVGSANNLLIGNYNNAFTLYAGGYAIYGPPISTSFVVHSVVQKANGDGQAWVNGVSAGTGAGGVTPETIVLLRYWPGGEHSNANVCEIVLADGMWSDSDRQAAEQAANSYWAIY